MPAREENILLLFMLVAGAFFIRGTSDFWVTLLYEIGTLVAQCHGHGRGRSSSFCTSPKDCVVVAAR